MTPLEWNWRELLELVGAAFGILGALAFIAKTIQEMRHRERIMRERAHENENSGHGFPHVVRCAECGLLDTFRAPTPCRPLVPADMRYGHPLGACGPPPRDAPPAAVVRCLCGHEPREHERKGGALGVAMFGIAAFGRCTRCPCPELRIAKEDGDGDGGPLNRPPSEPTGGPIP